MCKFMFEGDKFACHVTDNEYKINSRFDCDSPVLFTCSVVRYVGCSMLIARLPPFELGRTFELVISRVVGDLRKGKWLLRQIFIGILS